MNRVDIKNYYPGGNTPEGFYSFYKYLAYGADNIYIIKGGPGTGKSTFMKNVGTIAVEQGYDIELHWCSSDNDSVDGLVIPKKKIAFLDGTAPHTVAPIYPGAVDQILNFGRFWDKTKLMKSSKDIINLTKEISDHFKEVYKTLNKTKKIYDLQKKYQKEIIDNNRLISQSKKYITKIIPEDIRKKKDGSRRDLFGTAITPGGVNSFLAEISKSYENRYIILGNIGSGSGDLINLLGTRAYNFGYYVIYLHSTFEPSTINGIIIPEMKLSVVNGSFPKTIPYNSENIEIIDLSENFIENKYNNYSAESYSLKQIFNENIARAVEQLKKAKLTHDKLEEYYIASMDFERLNNLTADLIKKIGF